MSLSFSRRPRTWFYAISVALFGLAVVTLVMALRPSADGVGVPVELSILWAILGATWAATGIASNVLAIRAGGKPSNQRADLTAPVLLSGDAFVDRTGEIAGLGKALVTARCVNCYGQTGTGKSHMLGYVADVLNEHRPTETLRPMPGEVAAALYFDLADAVGFDQFVNYVCTSTFTDAQSWSQFIKKIDQEFDTERVILILDNVNASSLWPTIGRAVYEYLARRPADAVVLGSVEPMVFHNLRPSYLPVALFDRDAVAALARVGHPDLSPSAIEDLHERSGGLPMYLRLLLANNDRPDGSGTETAVSAFMRERVLPKLSNQTRVLAARIAVLAHGQREIAVHQLAGAAIPNLEDELDRAETRSLITVVTRRAGRVVRMHDLVRDEIVRLLPVETVSAANELVDLAAEQDQKLDACVFALFCDPHGVRVNVKQLISDVVDDAIAERNHPLLETIWEGAARNEQLLKHIQDDPDQRDLLAYAQASSLAGVGEYAEAERVLLTSAQGASTRKRSLRTREFGLKYLLADVTHLQNRYDESFEMFSELEGHAIASSDNASRAQCVWGQGHVLRHQGRDLKGALDLFDTAAELARACEQLSTEVLAVTNSTGLKAYLKVIPSSELDVLADLEGRVHAAGANTADLVKIWKAQARIAWLLDHRATAVELINKSVSELLSLNDRGIFNLYFERAEFARLSGDLDEARADYRAVATFANENGDRNLVANSILGLTACDLQSPIPLSPAAIAELRSELLRARQIAVDADVLVTVRNAERLAVLIDQPLPVGPQRFIVF